MRFAGPTIHRRVRTHTHTRTHTYTHSSAQPEEVKPVAVTVVTCVYYFASSAKWQISSSLLRDSLQPRASPENTVYSNEAHASVTFARKFVIICERITCVIFDFVWIHQIWYPCTSAKHSLSSNWNRLPLEPSSTI